MIVMLAGSTSDHVLRTANSFVLPLRHLPPPFENVLLQKRVRLHGLAKGRSEALCREIKCPCLFVGIAAQNIVQNRICPSAIGNRTFVILTAELVKALVVDVLKHIRTLTFSSKTLLRDETESADW